MVKRFATALRRRLEREQPEIALWQDRARLEGGIGWWQQITAALDTVEFLVLVMTPAAMESAIARKEWRYARQRGVCVYPVKGVPDAALDYPRLPKWMSSAHFFDLIVSGTPSYTISKVRAGRRACLSWRRTCPTASSNGPP
jgi:hypothetical protein